MGDQYIAPKLMRKMLGISSKQAYRLIEEKITKSGVKPPVIPYKRVECFGKPDTKEVLLSEIARYIRNTLPTKKADVLAEQKRIIHQEDTLKKLKERLGNAFPS
jgi:hypothetical protein